MATISKVLTRASVTAGAAVGTGVLERATDLWGDNEKSENNDIDKGISLDGIDNNFGKSGKRTSCRLRAMVPVGSIVLADAGAWAGARTGESTTAL